MKFRVLVSILFAPVFLSMILFVDRSQQATTAVASAAAVPQRTPVPPTSKPLYEGYKGVTMGTLATDARNKLGKPKESSDEQDFYVIAEGETAQILYDEAKCVKAISVTYVGAGIKPPTPAEVFGTTVEPKPDGSINKMVKYPKLGYWISYIRTEGSDPMIMLTIHKLQKGEQ